MNEQEPTAKEIEVKALVKRSNDKVLAVDVMALSIPANTIYALLGPPGPGLTDRQSRRLSRHDHVL
jgi:hypothetical protein